MPFYRKFGKRYHEIDEYSSMDDSVSEGIWVVSDNSSRITNYKYMSQPVSKYDYDNGNLSMDERINLFKISEYLYATLMSNLTLIDIIDCILNNLNNICVPSPIIDKSKKLYFECNTVYYKANISDKKYKPSGLFFHRAKLSDGIWRADVKNNELYKISELNDINNFYIDTNINKNKLIKSVTELLSEIKCINTFELTYIIIVEIYKLKN